jgi:N-carbamoyl-L-amino-acid hydrolase
MACARAATCQAPVGLGSHLDTQPTSSKFDSILGTLAALE